MYIYVLCRNGDIAAGCERYDGAGGENMSVQKQ